MMQNSGIMYCPGCGAENDDNAYRCVNCGEYLRSTEPRPYPVVRTSGLAIAALICSIVGWVGCYLIGPIVGVVLGYQARKQIRESGGRLTGEGLATAGIILGWLGIGLVLLAVIGLSLAVIVTGCNA